MENPTLDLLALTMAGIDVPDVADIIARPAWMDTAACRGVTGVSFFPAQGDDVRPAKGLCHGCPVRSECLDFALRDPLLIGVWGGTSMKERRRLRRAERASEAA